MATVVVQHHQQPQLRQSTPPPLTPALTLNTPRSSTPVPNKHLPFCPPGPIPSSEITPPNSPPSRTNSFKSTSLLYPPDPYQKLLNSPPIYGIDAKALGDVLNHFAAQPLPNPSSVFPWLHGLHPDNHLQLAFFVARKRSLRKVPKCLRGITIIKAGGDLSRARIKGAVAPDEVFNLCNDSGRGFLDCDPPEGFSVRNFHIQTTKMAQVSDIVIYGDDKTDHRIIKSVAERAIAVQRQWRKDIEATGQVPELYNTFVLTEAFEEFEQQHPDLIAIDSRGRSTSHVLDFLQQERTEMCTMSRASEISQGVYQGPTPDPNIITDYDGPAFDLYVEASDHASMPDEKLLRAKQTQLDEREDDEPVQISFPSSGSILPPSWSQSEVDGVVLMCRWLYSLTHSTRRRHSTRVKDNDGDIQMSEFSSQPRKILMHCADGYTETSLLAVAYFMYAEGLPVHQAWIKLHREKGRNFFAYPSDVALLVSLQDRLLRESPVLKANNKVEKAPLWLTKLDGSLPSRVLPYMYLGNLSHANNPEMLKLLGITRVLSVGEPVSWPASALQEWGRENLMMVDRVQDNGIDELSTEMERCLEFIGKWFGALFVYPADDASERGKEDGSATLVHCRVGVSRSATICIAEVMKEMCLSFPRA
jgi:dual specificity MAP kinase phosphatase